MISPEILARRIDQDKWTRLSEITRFSNFLNKIAKLLFHGDEVMLFGVGMIPSTGLCQRPEASRRKASYSDLPQCSIIEVKGEYLSLASGLARNPAATLDELPHGCRLAHFEKNELPFLWQPNTAM